MIIKNIVCLVQSVSITTGVEIVKMVKDEVRLVRFRDADEFMALLSHNNFTESSGPPPKVHQSNSVSRASDVKVEKDKLDQIKTEAEPKEPEIDRTGQDLIEDEVLIEDTGLVHLEGSIQCTICSKTMIPTTDTTKPEGKQNTLFCPKCEITIPVEDEEVEEKDNITGVHSKCLDCGKKFKTPRGLAMHITHVHRKKS